MVETKPCEICGTVIEKPFTCSRREWAKRRYCSRVCLGASKRGKPSWIAGREMPKTAPRHPCRICGQPTKYLASNEKLAGMVHCGRDECRAASQELKNQRIAERHRTDYATGKRARLRDNWSRVPLVSAEELLLSDWFTSLGWVAQHRVNTGVHTNKLPTQFRLDFALPDRLLYVEIDGSVHRLRKERDARRDAMLRERGWIGLRLPATLVRDDPEAAKRTVLDWIAQQSQH